MKTKLLFCFLIISTFSSTLLASDKDSTTARIAFGVTGGLSQHNSVSSDFYGGIIIPIKSTKIETNFGYTYFQNSTSYSIVNDLNFSSHGLYFDLNYHFLKGLYCGTKFSINFNWTDEESRNKCDLFVDIDAPTFFSGIAGYGHLGYYQPIGNHFGLRLQAQIGIHNYKISEGWILISNSNDDLINAQHGIEKHAEFLYNLSVGINYRL